MNEEKEFPICILPVNLRNSSILRLMILQKNNLSVPPNGGTLLLWCFIIYMRSLFLLSKPPYTLFSMTAGVGDRISCQIWSVSSKAEQPAHNRRGKVRFLDGSPEMRVLEWDGFLIICGNVFAIMNLNYLQEFVYMMIGAGIVTVGYIDAKSVDI